MAMIGPDHHDWDSPEYVEGWAQGQDRKEKYRLEPFRVLAETMPFSKTESIKILDLGAGYGALTQFLLETFPRATALCQDGSREMAKLGGDRMKALAGRFDYAICDFSQSGWIKEINDKFDAIVSTIAIHNVRDPNIIQRIYEDAHMLVNPGGCFLNFDRHHPPIDDQMNWLRGAGFKGVQCFWQDRNRALFGGFRKA